MHANTINLLLEDLKNHRVTVTLPDDEAPKDLNLILLAATISMLEDIKISYGDQVLPIHETLISKLFSDTPQDMTYGVFVNDEGHMLYSFNVLFAEYDPEEKMVFYKDLNTFLTDGVTAKAIEPPEEIAKRIQRMPRRFPRCGAGVMSYSLPNVDEKT